MKWFFVLAFLSCVTYVHFRGRVRHRFTRQLFDHSAVMAPINVFMYAFSRTPTTPYLDVSQFPELRVLEDNWQMIRDEGIAMAKAEVMKNASTNSDAGFNSFMKVGWQRFYLKWYGANHPSAQQYCPRTVALLNSIPSVKAGMFAFLPVGSKLNRHRDPYGGSLRYHLGLITPNDDSCYIEVDGQRYSWRDGQSVMFDETYIHEAYNGSGTDRLILFCDVERKMKFGWAQAINRFLGNTIVTAASSPNEAGDRVGFINKVFGLAFTLGQYRRRFKKWNRTAYRVTKVALIVAAIGLIIWL